MRSCLVPRGSTGPCLVVGHSPEQWAAMHFGFASAGGPTDDHAATRTADPVAPGKASRSPESGFPPAASESSPHRADHVSASGARLLESSPDDQPGIRFPALPSGSQTTASIPWLPCPHAPGVEAWNKTLAPCCLRASESHSRPLPLRCPASPTFAGERASHIL